MLFYMFIFIYVFIYYVYCSHNVFIIYCVVMIMVEFDDYLFLLEMELIRNTHDIEIVFESVLILNIVMM
jgi:hypothetical protein